MLRLSLQTSIAMSLDPKIKTKQDLDLEIGRSFERKFAEKLGGDVIWATKEQDIYDHWDLEHNGIKYDVKGDKGDYHWIEFQNVVGRKGWIYGEADAIAFYIYDLWVIVDRLELLEWCRVKIPNIPAVHEVSLYTPRRRNKRKDIAVMVKHSDLINLANKIIE